MNFLTMAEEEQTEEPKADLVAETKGLLVAEDLKEVEIRKETEVLSVEVMLLEAVADLKALIAQDQDVSLVLVLQQA
jgi:hypothetical protein